MEHRKSRPSITLLATIILLSVFASGIETKNHARRPENLDPSFSRETGLFAAEIYRTIISNTNRNVVISPLSISTCLSFAAMGAAGSTANQMFSVLKHNSAESKTAIAQQYGALMASVAAEQNLKIANKIYLKQDLSPKQSFSNLANEHFRSETESVDFAQNVDAANKINSWVEQKTNNKIKNLFDPSSLNAGTQMVLVNAIHFKGTWKTQFDPASTMPMPFWNTPTQSADVPTMSLNQNLKHGVFDDFSALVLPYANSDVSMLIILPNQRDGLTHVEGQLTNLDLSALTSSMRVSKIDVYLPKFKIEFDIDLGDTLKQLGMTEMFSDGADFSELAEGGNNMKVSQVVHKAFIEVNEEGAEAAAATGIAVVLKMSSGPKLPPPVFRVDHPFMFTLFDRKSNVHLFIGSVRNIT